MEPSNEIKIAIITQAISEFEYRKYLQETMGQTWQTIGSAANAEACAKQVTECVMAITELSKKLEALKE
jgi:hypothetical protein